MADCWTDPSCRIDQNGTDAWLTNWLELYSILQSEKSSWAELHKWGLNGESIFSKPHARNWEPRGFSCLALNFPHELNCVTQLFSLKGLLTQTWLKSSLVYIIFNTKYPEHVTSFVPHHNLLVVFSSISSIFLLPMKMFGSSKIPHPRGHPTGTYYVN